LNIEAQVPTLFQVLPPASKFEANGTPRAKKNHYLGMQVILNKPVREWPHCQVLLTWHSTGFPLRKAQEYVKVLILLILLILSP
jgi:hypothetical protein